jgi:ankyrin repeat protein
LKRWDKPIFAELLVKNSNVDLNVRKLDDGMTPFLYVCWRGIISVFRAMLPELSKDALNAKDSRGNNALFLNISGSTNRDIISGLLARSSFLPEFLLSDESSVYHLCSHYHGSVAIPLIFKRFPDWDINARVNDVTALDLACMKRDLKCCEAFLRLPGIELSPYFMGRHPLHRFAGAGMEACVRLLINKGLDCNATNKYGLSVLMYSVMKCRTEVVRFLLSLPNIDVNYCIDWGQSAFLMASTLVEGAPIVHLLLLHPSCNVNHTNYEGHNALSLAIEENMIDIVELILMYADRFDFINKPGHKDRYPFLLAIAKGKTRLVEFFLSCRSVDPHVCTDTGLNAVHLALLSRKKKILKMVLGVKGIDVNKGSSLGTPLMLATQMRNLSLQRLLVKYLSKVDSQTRNEVIAVSSLLAVLDETKQ